MTISSNLGRRSYSGDGSSTEFTVPFKFFANGDISVVLQSAAGVDATLTEGVHYTLTGAGSESGGEVVLSTAPVSGETLTVLLDPDLLQETDYVSNDPFPAESHERALDRLTQMAIRSRNLVTRSMRLPDGDSVVDLELPGAAARASKYIVFASDGSLEVAESLPSGTLSQSVIAQYLFPQTAAEVSASVTPTNYAYSFGDLRRYGGVGDGVTDDSTAWQRALNVGKAFIPKGYSFRIDTGATLSGSVHVVGEGPLSKLLCDSYVLTLTNGDTSTFEDFAVENITAPLTIQRRVETTVTTTATTTSGSTSITVASATGIVVGMQAYGPNLWSGSVVQSVVGTTVTLSRAAIASGSGSNVKFFDITFNTDAAAVSTLSASNAEGRYTPNTNDADVWPGLSGSQQAQAQIGPILQITGDHMRLNRLHGRHLSILVTNSNHCTVSGCNLRGGWTWAAIMFLTTGGTRTQNNRAENNIVRDHGFNGIAAMACDGVQFVGNTAIGVGESGFKLFFGIDYADGCTNIVSVGNKAVACFQGAFDYQNLFPNTGVSSLNGTSIGDHASWCPLGAFGFGGSGWRIDVTAAFCPGPAFYGVMSDSFIKVNAVECMYDNLNTGVANNVSVNGPNNVVADSRVFQETNRWNATTGYQLVVVGGITNSSNSVIRGCDLRDGLTALTGAIQTTNLVKVENVRTNGTPWDIIPQEFVFSLTNTAGTLQHAFYAHSGDLSLGNYAEKVNGATATNTNTPTATDSSTAMAGGGKIGSASTNVFWVDTATQTHAEAFMAASVIYNDTATAGIVVRPQFASVNINGVTRTRLRLEFITSAGAAFALTTANIGSGKTIQVQFSGRLT